MQTEKINIEKLTKCKNIQMRSVANRVMTFLAKQLAIFITSSNSRCHYVEDLMLLWELVSLRRGSVIYLGLSQGQPAIRYIYTISTLCKPGFFFHSHLSMRIFLLVKIRLIYFLLCIVSIFFMKVETLKLHI